MKKNLLLFFAFVSILLSSCTSEYEILKSFDSVILSSDGSIRIIDETVTFTVKDNDGNDLTADATILVDGNEIDGNTFTSATVGEFEVTAKYFGTTSDPISIRFHDGSEINFNKRVLIEDYTGTWCGYCPRVSYGIDLLKNQTDNVVAVAIHRASLNPNDASYDPFTFDSTELENFINIPGYPKGLINRLTQWFYPEPNNLDQVIGLTQGENPKLGLAISSTKDGNNLAIDVNVMFGKDFNSDLNLVVYVLENGLIYDQYNYTTYYNGPNTLYDYEHNHVLRAALTPLMGEAIPRGETTTLNTYTKTFNISVPEIVDNANNIEFVAFVTDADGHALNVRSAHPDENQEFEQL
ncbi:Omp28-related outer membrane protein [Flavobacterium litorale]|uniref:Omp28-related outer membrane protein n=1 Tax=Flavobacterium litorale TaxID=2856519 RepID=A0ABX8V8W6_9FLAO|nr:Omp28-related outer membrane protein [Flavobacterium litorale]QYJ69275.1 Omp28-related outer membrane protein [Flavobacterium litorale]